MPTPNSPHSSYVSRALRLTTGAILAMATLLLGTPERAGAHTAGRLDPYGCHADNRKSHDYHCHRGLYNGLRFRSKSEMVDNKKAGVTAEELKAIAKEQEASGETPVVKKESGGWSLLDLGKKEAEISDKVASGAGNTIVPKGLEQRLRTLKSLHGEGLISDEEYAQKKAEILGDL